MFTGIVEELGSVERRDGSRLRLSSPTVLADAEMGASIAVNGCCLTVVAFDADRGWWEADVSDETYRCTSLGGLSAGDPVNLERPVTPATRLGGHIVQGHVDAVGRVLSPVPELEVGLPAELMRYVVEKGSITVDGVSLTVVDVLPSSFTVAVIPHTSRVTTLGARSIGDPVNLEVDVTAKYIESLIEARLDPPGATEAPSAGDLP